MPACPPIRLRSTISLLSKFMLSTLLLLACHSSFAATNLPSHRTASKAPAKAPSKLATKNELKAKKPAPQLWKGSNATLGMQAITGNSRSSNLQSSITAIYTKPRWNINAQFQTDYGTGEDGAVIKEQYAFGNQLTINFNPKSQHPQYSFANANFKIAKFSPYNYTQNLSAGYGITAINKSFVTLKMQAGPGYQHSISRNGHDVIADDAAINTQTDITLDIYKKVCSLQQTVIYTMSKPYNFLNSVTKLNNTITKHFAISANYELNYYSVIPQNSDHKKKLDTTASLNLVYNL